jgi:hypothetical protein
MLRSNNSSSKRTRETTESDDDIGWLELRTTLRYLSLQTLDSSKGTALNSLPRLCPSEAPFQQAAVDRWKAPETRMAIEKDK